MPTRAPRGTLGRVTAPFSFPVIPQLAGEVPDPLGDLFSVLSRGDIISFAGGIPNASLFEFDDIRASFEFVLAHDERRALQYGSTEGDPGLRAEAARLVSRDLPSTAENFLITTGSQEGIFLTAQVMLRPGDVVLVEEPTYLAAVQAFTLNGARLVSVPTDDHGVLPDALERAIAAERPKFAYLIPTFQNPSGKSMPPQRRRDVAEILVRTGVPLVEDDPYGALRFEGEPAPPIASLPGMGRQSLLLHSLSKIMAPGVRIGWVRGDGPIMKTLAIAKAAVSLQSSALTQMAVAHYLANCDLDAHIRRVIDVYRVRRDAMYNGLIERLPSAAHVTHPEGGMFCWVTLGGGIDTRPLLDAAVARGVAFVPGWAFFAGTPDLSTMRLSYVTNSPATIAEGLDRLALTLADAVAAPAPAAAHGR